MSDFAADQIGLVEPRSVVLCENGLMLDSGISFGPITVAYETYGTLNPARDNAIMVCHALTMGAHAAGYLPGQAKPGWWDAMIGPGKPLDTNRYFVVCPNVIGSCYGTTGPASIDPATGKPFGLRFPVVTIRDMVRVQAALLDHLGIECLLGAIGGSMGGMMALQWAVSCPDRIRAVIALASTWRHSAQQIAFNEVQRQAIMSDPKWNNGDYYDQPEGPRHGLAVARMVGHVTYLSHQGMKRKFGRRLRDRERYGFDFSTDFEVESYLRYQGQSFVERFDANALLYMTKALDYFDLSRDYGSVEEAFASSKSLFLLMAFSSDWLYPPEQMKEVARAIRFTGGEATYCEISSDYGHDAFLAEGETIAPYIVAFLERATRERRN